jgi:hypothetical protein
MPCGTLLVYLADHLVYSYLVNLSTKTTFISLTILSTRTLFTRTLFTCQLQKLFAKDFGSDADEGAAFGNGDGVVVGHAP